MRLFGLCIIGQPESHHAFGSSDEGFRVPKPLFELFHQVRRKVGEVLLTDPAEEEVAPDIHQYAEEITQLKERVQELEQQIQELS